VNDAPEPGLLDGGEQLLASACAAEVLVAAPPARAAAALGRATALARGGARLADPPAEARAWVAAAPGGWSLVELLERAEGDYLLPLLEDARAALDGTLAPGLDLYERPAAAAAALARALAAPAIALWASAEAPGLLGGAFFRAGGALEEVVSGLDAEELDGLAVVRARWSRHDDEPPGVADPGEGAVRRVGAAEPTRSEEAALPLLDRALRACGAAEPPAPIELDDPVWDEVWAAGG